MHGYLEALLQLRREQGHFLGLNTDLPAQSQRVAYHQFHHFILPDHIFKLREIRALVLALDGFQALRGDAQWVGYGDTDAAGADIERENATADWREFKRIQMGIRHEPRL